MSAVQIPTAPSVAARRGSLLAGATALCFALEAAVAAAWPAGIADHATGAGRVSEALAGAAFLLAAATLVALVPRVGRPGRWFLPAVLGCAAVGIAQVDIAARGQEWPETLTTGIVLVAWAGLVAAGIVGARAGAWSWPAGVALAAVLPALFLLPSPVNSVVLALLWVAVAGAVRRAARAR